MEYAEEFTDVLKLEFTKSRNPSTYLLLLLLKYSSNK